MDRLRTGLRLRSPRPVLPSDFEVLALNEAGVARAVAIDGYDPDDSSCDNERMIAVAVADSEGNPVSPTIKDNVAAYLSYLREVNFIVNVIDPKYTDVDVSATIKVTEGAKRLSHGRSSKPGRPKTSSSPPSGRGKTSSTTTNSSHGRLSSRTSSESWT